MAITTDPTGRGAAPVVVVGRVVRAARGVCRHARVPSFTVTALLPMRAGFPTNGRRNPSVEPMSGVCSSRIRAL